MSKLKSELSKSNPYWIPKHRYYELQHFCRLYPIWVKARRSLDSLYSKPVELAIFKTNEHDDPTVKCVEAREKYTRLIYMVDKAAEKTSSAYSEFIILGVTEGVTYDAMYSKYHADLPSRQTYYNLYRKFFWILSQMRE